MTEKINLEISTPIKAVEANTENYLLIIRDAKDTYHFFLKNGKYDGIDAPCESEEGKKLLSNCEE